MPKKQAKSPEEGGEVALRLLGFRDYSREEMRRKLLRKGLEAREVEGVLGRLEARGLLDDQRFARRLAAFYTLEKLWGPQRVLQKLLQKGIARELAGRVTDEAAGEGGSSRERLRKVLGSKTKRRGLEKMSSPEKKRLAGYLYQRGFPWDDIIEVLQEAGGSTEE
jgi:regulatory protein